MTADVQQFRRGEVNGFVPPWNTGVSNAITTAINAANYAQNGVLFEPFMIKVVPGTGFYNIWNSERGSNPITFYQYFGGADPYRTLGDLVVFSSLPNNDQYRNYPDGAMLFAPSASHPDALAQPIGFQWILDDYRSGNSRDIKYYRIIPPAGYSACGIAFTNGGPPDPTHYWCVKTSHLISIGRQFVWSDDGQHWTKHTGDLWKPVFEGKNAPGMPDGEMLLIPQTWLSFEDRGNETAWALRMQTAELPVTVPTPDPVFNKDTRDGTMTTYGVKSVKVMPFTTVADPGYPTAGMSSPFYYIAAEPFWYCSEVLDTREGGERTRTVTIGVSHLHSEAFAQSTSITVSAEVGAAYDGVGAKVSTSFTKEWDLSTADSTEHSTQVTTTEKVKYPQSPTTQVWEYRTQIAVYRSDSSQLVPVTYINKTTKFLP